MCAKIEANYAIIILRETSSCRFNFLSLCYSSPWFSTPHCNLFTPTAVISCCCDVFRKGEKCGSNLARLGWGAAACNHFEIRERKLHVQAAQIWVSGGFALWWSVTQASMKIALCLKCRVWQLAIKTLSVVMHGGVWRPEDLLSKLCTYCSWGCAVVENFHTSSNNPVSWEKISRNIFMITINAKMIHHLHFRF